MKRNSSLLAVALVVFVALGVMALVLGPVGSVSADPDGGIVSKSTARTLAAGATAYTTTGNVSLSTLNVGAYGSLQIQVADVVTDSAVLTVVPQFSNEPANATTGSCSAVTGWFTATEYVPYVAYTVSSQTVTATGILTSATSVSTGSMTEGNNALSFTVTGSQIAGREIPIQGQCFRLKLNYSAAGQTYTPTIYIRAVNRQ